MNLFFENAYSLDSVEPYTMVSSSSLTNYEASSKTFNNFSSNGNGATQNGKSAIVTSNGKSLFARNSFNTKRAYSKNGSSPNANKSTNANQFNTSISSNASDFYFRTLLRYARSGGPENYPEKVSLKSILCCDASY